MLTQERLKELLHYNPDTGVFTRKTSITKFKKDSIAGSNKPQHTEGYVQIKIDNVCYKAHRLVWLYVYNKWPEFEIDHINGIRHDNRLLNLRNVQKAHNLQNQKAPHKHNKSGFLGVKPHGKKWAASIRLNKKDYYLGCYQTKEEASQAYLAEKKKLHPYSTS